MNAKKKRDKDRRRARRLAEQAWEAADDDNFDLGVKIIRRAVELDPGNPVLRNDQGLLLRQLNDDDKASESFQAAICLAADFAEAYANLAEIRAQQGNTRQAVTLQREAVRHAPETERYRNNLTAYEALVGHGDGPQPLQSESAARSSNTGVSTEHTLRIQFPGFASRVDNLGWSAIEDSLTRHGYAHVPELLSTMECETLRRMFDDPCLFSKTVTMNKSRFGKGTYRYFGTPLPSLVDVIRRLMYSHAVRIANNWQRLLHEEQQYPATWPGFQSRCAEAGQTTPSPLLLRYESGGFNAPHQDIRGEVYFPLQLVIVLSPRAESAANDSDSFSGGDFLFCDEPQRKKSDRRYVPAGLGDAVLFCTRARLVRIAGLYGLKSVKHGMGRVTSGTRYAIGIPFHEFD